jgi:hypothetical protein
MDPAFTLNYETKFTGRRGEPGGRRRGTEQMMPGPDVERTHPLGLAGLAFEAEVYLRQRRISLRLRLPFEFPQGGELVEPRPEGLFLRPLSEELR